jgi:hypothetical protein
MHSGCSPKSIQKLNDGAYEMTYSSPDGDKTGTFDQILMATGRGPNTTNLGLEDVGVEMDKKGCASLLISIGGVVVCMWTSLASHPDYFGYSLQSFRLIQSKTMLIKALSESFGIRITNAQGERFWWEWSSLHCCRLHFDVSSDRFHSFCCAWAPKQIGSHAGSLWWTSTPRHQ